MSCYLVRAVQQHAQRVNDFGKPAIGLEKESILFYLGLKDMVPPKYGQEKLDQIIHEEQRHVTQLSAFRKKFQGKGA